MDLSFSPKDLYFTSPSFSDVFDDGRSVYDLVHELKFGTTSPWEIPCIRVVCEILRFTYSH